MNTPAHRGFTIIEVMLFLAVSGVMIALLLGGWTIMINTQRYKDSVDTIYGYIQDQYNLVYNVENERSDTMTCSNGTITMGGAGSSRGQSECILMGRYIKLTEGTTFTSYAVVGSEPSDPSGGSDTDLINSYNPKVVTESIGISEEKQIVPWGAQIKRPGANDALNSSMLLLRSPGSGVVHRYIIDGARADAVIDDGDIASENEATNATFCFDPGVVVQGAGQAVTIGAYASSRNSVETLSGDQSGC